MFVTLHGAAPGAAPSVKDYSASEMSARIAAHLMEHDYDQPTLIVDLDAVARQYHALCQGLGRAHIHYAVKANPAPEVIERLVAEGSSFDAASRAEIELCLGKGARAAQISFGNTIKRPRDIAWAHSVGIDLFAVDASEEMIKIAQNAPGARVYIRLLVEISHGDWPLSRKFGASHETALALFDEAKALGLNPVGISFHVGSQTRKADMWEHVLEDAARLWDAAIAAGHDLTLLNIGGGFPAFYGEDVQAAASYCFDVMTRVQQLFGQVPYIMAEPGRGLVGDAGVIAAEVLLVSKKRESDIARWVYLDIGKFSGLAETMDESIRYQFETDADGSETGPCILAGPTCDSADVMYEKRAVQLPLSLKSGDKVRILATGAYTSSYASVNFNGIPPLDVVCI